MRADAALCPALCLTSPLAPCAPSAPHPPVSVPSLLSAVLCSSHISIPLPASVVTQFLSETSMSIVCPLPLAPSPLSPPPVPYTLGAALSPSPEQAQEPPHAQYQWWSLPGTQTRFPWPSPHSGLSCAPWVNSHPSLCEPEAPKSSVIIHCEINPGI